MIWLTITFFFFLCNLCVTDFTRRALGLIYQQIQAGEMLDRVVTVFIKLSFLSFWHLCLKKICTNFVPFCTDSMLSI
jgi:hypothetical protein